jgi:hypothetical protein
MASNDKRNSISGICLSKTNLCAYQSLKNQIPALKGGAMKEEP